MDKIEKFQAIICCLIIVLGLLFVSLIFASRIPKSENITVTGSAYKIVKSDSAKLGFDIQSKAKTQKEAYAIIKAQYPEVIKYLQAKGIDSKNIETKPISSYFTYKTGPNGYSTNEIASYNASQEIQITSNDVEKIKNISTDIQNLTEKGINLTIFRPEYFYSDLASIKVDLLKEATLDAKQRAESMLKAAGANVGKVKQMRMGVFQITPPESTMVSDMGVNDTTTIDKKVTAVANIVFKVK